eukprot:scaffold275168_cov18-Tisochrysis_lutea.AAC.3
MDPSVLPCLPDCFIPPPTPSHPAHLVVDLSVSPFLLPDRFISPPTPSQPAPLEVDRSISTCLLICFISPLCLTLRPWMWDNFYHPASLIASSLHSISPCCGVHECHHQAAEFSEIPAFSIALYVVCVAPALACSYLVQHHLLEEEKEELSSWICLRELPS